MKRNIAIHVRKRTWVIATAILIAFCCLGFAADGFGAFFHGLNTYLTSASRFVFAYGRIGFPVFGVVAATAFILSGIFFRNQRVQWALVVVFVLFIIWALNAVFFSPWDLKDGPIR